MNDDDDTIPVVGGSYIRRTSMTEQESTERRKSIQAIMKDPTLTATERRKSIQSLMDGRRRSSGRRQTGPQTGMAAAAALAAAEFVDSSDEEDDEREMVHHQNEDTKNTNNNSSINNNSDCKPRAETPSKRGSTHDLTNEKSGKRRTSLRESFTLGFANISVEHYNIMSNGGSGASGGGGGGDIESSSRSGASGDGDPLARRMEKSRPPCDHYERHCSVVSPCCGMVFGCRICHDDAPELPPPFLISGGQPSPTEMAAGVCHSTDEFAAAATSSTPVSTKPPTITHRSASMPANFSEEESHHEINRFMIKEVICRECFTRQSSKT